MISDRCRSVQTFVDLLFTFLPLLRLGKDTPPRASWTVKLTKLTRSRQLGCRSRLGPRKGLESLQTPPGPSRGKMHTSASIPCNSVPAAAQTEHGPLTPSGNCFITRSAGRNQPCVRDTGRDQHRDEVRCTHEDLGGGKCGASQAVCHLVCPGCRILRYGEQTWRAVFTANSFLLPCGLVSASMFGAGTPTRWAVPVRRRPTPLVSVWAYPLRLITGYLVLPCLVEEHATGGGGACNDIELRCPSTCTGVDDNV